MSAIGQIVEQALEAEYLTVDAENKLRRLLKKKCGSREMGTFMSLQKAVITGLVKQQSRELHRA